MERVQDGPALEKEAKPQKQEAKQVPGIATALQEFHKAGFSSSDEGSGSETNFAALPSPRQRQRTQPSAATSPRTPVASAPPRNGTAAFTEAELWRSPFIDVDHPVTLYEGIKLAVMAPVVVLKLLLLAAAVVYAWAVMSVLLMGHAPQTPMSPFRSLLVRSWIHQWGRFLLLLSGFYRIPVRGWANLRAAQRCRAILVFNHPSYVDAAAIATFFTPSGVSKAGVVQIPLIGLFARALQLFFVERKGSSDRANKYVLQGDAVQAITARAADHRFPLVAIAPEATTKAKPCMLRFRRGAFAPGRPVCPVLLKYRFKHFNPGWGIVCTPFHVFRLLAQFVNHLEIEVLPPYHPSDDEQRDWQLYAENVRQLMAARLGVPLVDQGLAEERALVHAGATVNLRGDKAYIATPKRKTE